MEVGDSECCMKAELKRNGIGKQKCLLGSSEAYEALLLLLQKHFSKSTLLSVYMLELRESREGRVQSGEVGG